LPAAICWQPRQRISATRVCRGSACSRSRSIARSRSLTSVRCECVCVCLFVKWGDVCVAFVCLREGVLLR
jgi:hypothetical protein